LHPVCAPPTLALLLFNDTATPEIYTLSLHDALPIYLVILGGDYSLKDKKYIGPCFDVLAGLRAPLGVFGVLGNHDYWHGVRSPRSEEHTSELQSLTNLVCRLLLEKKKRST